MTPNLLFVHSPVAGPSTWTYTAQALRQKGFGCVVPDLTEVPSPPYYPKYAEAASAAVADETGPVVVVGHSAAGALLPAIAEAVGDRTRGALFVDAMLPQPGRSWFDTAPAGTEAQLRELAADGVLPPYDKWFPPGTLAQLVPDPVRLARLIAEVPRLPLHPGCEGIGQTAAHAVTFPPHGRRGDSGSGTAGPAGFVPIGSLV